MPSASISVSMPRSWNSFISRTVISHAAVKPRSETEIVAVPLPIAVTVPSVLIAATFALLLVHTASLESGSPAPVDARRT